MWFDHSRSFFIFKNLQSPKRQKGEINMEKIMVHVTTQAKALRVVCKQWTGQLADLRYKELRDAIRDNITISQIVSLIGEALIKEESDFEKEIELDLNGKNGNVNFSKSHFALTCSDEIVAELCELMGW